MKQRLKQFLILSCVTASSIAGLAVLQIPRLREISFQNQNLTEVEYQQQVQQENIRLSVLEKTPTFGFNSLLADWVFLQFLQYFGDEPARRTTGYGLSPEYFDIVLARDPRFLEAYFFLSGSTSFYAGMPERSVELMNQHLPELSPTVPNKAYYIWRYKGIDELLLLGDADAAENSFRMTAEWASVYNDQEGQAIAESAQQTAEFLAQNPNSRSAQISTWVMVYNNAFDQTTRQLAVQQIEALGATISTDENGNLTIRLANETSDN
ncbi:MAG: hypothetical protein ACTS2F_06590 [Thainema sp.]